MHLARNVIVQALILLSLQKGLPECTGEVLHAITCSTGYISARDLNLLSSNSPQKEITVAARDDCPRCLFIMAQ
jgi:hypothetical protein